MMKYMPRHTQCPYYDNSTGTCSRKGCLFLTPCIVSNEPRFPRTWVKFIRKGEKHDTRRK